MATRPTTEELYLRGAKHSVDTIATRLEALARRLRETSEQYNSTSSRASALATSAEIIEQFTSGIGNIAPFLGTAVRTAQDLDAFRLAN
jgi:hypothetical protein